MLVRCVQELFCYVCVVCSCVTLSYGCFHDSDLPDDHDIIFSVPVWFIDFMQRLCQVDGSLLHPCRNQNTVSDVQETVS